MKQGKLPAKQHRAPEATSAVQPIPSWRSGSRRAPDPAFHDSIRKEAGQGKRKAPTCFGHEAPAAIGARPRPSRPRCGAAQRRGSAWRSDRCLDGDTHRVSRTHFTSPARPHLNSRPPSLFAEVRLSLRRVALTRRRRRHLPAATTALPPLRACARGDGGGRRRARNGGPPGRGGAVPIAVPVG